MLRVRVTSQFEYVKAPDEKVKASGAPPAFPLVGTALKDAVISYSPPPLEIEPATCLGLPVESAQGECPGNGRVANE